MPPPGWWLKVAPGHQARFAALLLAQQWQVCRVQCVPFLRHGQQSVFHTCQTQGLYSQWSSEFSISTLHCCFQRCRDSCCNAILCAASEGVDKVPKVGRGWRGGHQPPRRCHQGHRRSTTGRFGVQTMTRVILGVYSSCVRPLQPWPAGRLAGGGLRCVCHTQELAAAARLVLLPDWPTAARTLGCNVVRRHRVRGMACRAL